MKRQRYKTAALLSSDCLGNRSVLQSKAFGYIAVGTLVIIDVYAIGQSAVLTDGFDEEMTDIIKIYSVDILLLL